MLRPTEVDFSQRNMMALINSTGIVRQIVKVRDGMILNEGELCGCGHGMARHSLLLDTIDFQGKKHISRKVVCQISICPCEDGHLEK